MGIKNSLGKLQEKSKNRHAGNTSATELIKAMKKIGVKFVEYKAAKPKKFGRPPGKSDSYQRTRKKEYPDPIPIIRPEAKYDNANPYDKYQDV